MYSTDVDAARAFALRAHGDQVDKAGMPYTGHLSRVAAGVATDEARVVAWLHDTVEDTGATLGEITARFGAETAHAVDCMTHRPGERYGDYLARVKSDPVARLVKISDLTDNSNLTRMPFVRMKDVARQAKYNRALRYMMTCCTFLQEDAEAAGRGMETEFVKRYPDERHMFDEGGRSLLRCRRCGCLMLVQRSEFHGFSDGSYSDYFPVASEAEADWLNRHTGPMDIEEQVPERFLRRTNGAYGWSG